MANPDLITALQNAIDRGESLEEAVTILINSGYNPKEVQEASHYVGGGVLNSAKPRPGEELTMPSQKNSFGNLKPWNPNNESKQNSPVNIPTQLPQQSSQQKPAFNNPAYPAQQQNMQNNQYNLPQNNQPQKQTQGNAQSNQPYPTQKNNETPQSDSQIFMKNLGLSDNQGPSKDNQQMIINQSRSNESTGMPKSESLPSIEQPSLYPPQANNAKTYKKSYTKEIILLVVLLLLVGLLTVTIIFKDTIISWFA
jgi:hypothetical protein